MSGGVYSGKYMVSVLGSNRLGKEVQSVLSSAKHAVSLY